ncbi:hypothetical protein PR048_019984 [Dryococelus australis]|uniref:Uncharacterized protein n=1 Tax=Dryococelus australis TaxID=614101 RepID=A0ABQ9H503_9NEOP|nr:hypothetical protein PR048_019984 [Dryococelus australis]
MATIVVAPTKVVVCTEQKGYRPHLPGRRTVAMVPTKMGAVVAERLYGSPPTKANRVQSLVGPLPDLHIVGIGPDDTAGRPDFSGFSRFPLPCVPTLLNYTCAIANGSLAIPYLVAGHPEKSLNHKDVTVFSRYVVRRNLQHFAKLDAVIPHPSRQKKVTKEEAKKGQKGITPARREGGCALSVGEHRIDVVNGVGINESFPKNKTRRQAASFATIPACENPGSISSRIEPSPSRGKQFDIGRWCNDKVREVRIQIIDIRQNQQDVVGNAIEQNKPSNYRLNGSVFIGCHNRVAHGSLGATVCLDGNVKVHRSAGQSNCYMDRVGEQLAQCFPAVFTCDHPVKEE